MAWYDEFMLMNASQTDLALNMLYDAVEERLRRGAFGELDELFTQKSYNPETGG